MDEDREARYTWDSEDAPEIKEVGKGRAIDLADFMAEFEKSKSSEAGEAD